ncbi:MAG: hypothetical protein C0418_02380 [Coriobacteriaceae bacterium]|nr:hypothetical protein [Coriobacteriaceae bacterium]
MNATRVLTLTATLLVALAAVPLGGCAPRGSSPAVVVEQAEESSGTITPLLRGTLRREALSVARAAIAAWLADDLSALREYVSDEQMRYFTEQAQAYEAEGRVRVRRHSNTKMDVVQMSENGREVQVTYDFIDDSYFTDSSGASVSKPAHAARTFQIFMVSTDGRWVVTRILAGEEELQ